MDRICRPEDLVISPSYEEAHQLRAQDWRRHGDYLAVLEQEKHWNKLDRVHGRLYSNARCVAEVKGVVDGAHEEKLKVESQLLPLAALPLLSLLIERAEEMLIHANDLLHLRALERIPHAHMLLHVIETAERHAWEDLQQRRQESGCKWSSPEMGELHALRNENAAVSLACLDELSGSREETLACLRACELVPLDPERSTSGSRHFWYARPREKDEPGSSWMILPHGERALQAARRASSQD